MSKSLESAIQGNAWSVAGVIFDLDDMLDDEGRPVSERRADAETRAGVEMDIRECPYHDVRYGRLMNKSALNQVGKHYNEVLEEVALLRARLGGAEATWSDIFAVVLDQLARPAIYLLEKRDTEGPVPARAAVSHKLGAGFFSIMRTLHERIAQGFDLPVFSGDFRSLIEETGALLGASEACAGPPKMIWAASAALVDGKTVDGKTVDANRVCIARCLGLQVQLGIFWRLYDATHLWAIVRGDIRPHLKPWNDYLKLQLERSGKELAATPPKRPRGSALPEALDNASRRNLRMAIEEESSKQDVAEDVDAVSQLLAEGGSVIAFDGNNDELSLRIALYLNAYRRFHAHISGLEQELRNHLGYPADAPISLGSAIFPGAKALSWYERILGRRMDETGRLTGTTSGIRVPTSSNTQDVQSLKTTQTASPGVPGPVGY